MGNDKQKGASLNFLLQFIIPLVQLAYACVLNYQQSNYLTLAAFIFPLAAWGLQLLTTIMQVGSAKRQARTPAVVNFGFFAILVICFANLIYAYFLNYSSAGNFNAYAFIVPLTSFTLLLFFVPSPATAKVEPDAQALAHPPNVSVSKDEELALAIKRIATLEEANKKLQLQTEQQTVELNRLKTIELNYNTAVQQATAKLVEQMQALQESLNLEKDENDKLTKQLQEEKRTGAEIKEQVDTLRKEVEERSAQLAEQHLLYEKKLKAEAEEAGLKYNKLSNEKDAQVKELNNEIAAGKQAMLAINGNVDKLSANMNHLSKEHSTANIRLARYKDMLQFLENARFQYLKNKKIVEITDFVRFAIIANDVANEYMTGTKSKNSAIIEEGKNVDSLKDASTRLTHSVAILNNDLTFLIKWAQQNKALLPNGRWDLFFENKEIDPEIKF